MTNIKDRREVAAKLRKYIPYAKMHDKQGDYVMESDKCVNTRCMLYNDIESCIEDCGNFNLSAPRICEDDPRCLSRLYFHIAKRAPRICGDDPVGMIPWG